MAQEPTIQSLFPEIYGISTQQQPTPIPESSAPTIQSLFPEIYGLPTNVSAPPPPQESGFWATIKKSFADSADYIALAGLGLDGAEGDEDEIARRITDLTRRQQQVAKSASHQYILDVARKEGRDISDAEGFIDTTLQTLDFAGKFLWGAVTKPLGTAEFVASQAGNTAFTLAGMTGGALAGSVAGPVGTIAGSRAGAGLAGATIETGAAYYEALSKAGVDISDQDAVIRAVSDPDFQRKMYAQGLTKGITIGLVDAAFMGLSKMPGTKAGRELQKDLAKEGIDIKAKNGWDTVRIRQSEDAIQAAFEKYAKAPKPKLVGTKKFAIETAGEGIGEAAGGLAAFGETSAEDIALEMLGSAGQSAVQASVATALSGSKEMLSAATKAAARMQNRSVAEGRPSGIEPSDLNEALQRQKEGIGSIVSPTTTENIRSFEETMEDASDQTVADNVRNALQEEGFNNYRSVLQETLRDSLNADTVTVFVPLTKEDQAVVQSGGNLQRPIKGSLSRTAVQAKAGKTNKAGEAVGGQDVVGVRVPVADVIMRGNWNNLELVINPANAALINPRSAPVAAPAPVSTLATKLEDQAQALERQDVEQELDRQVEVGELEAQATDRSQRDVASDINEASNKSANKLAQLRTADEYDTVEQLQKVVDKNKLPTFPGQRGKRLTMSVVLGNYRKALSNPDSTSAVNSVLAPTGYKVSKRKDGVYIVPIDDKPALRIPNTGNREVGQSTVDDYLFWIREEQAQGQPATTEAQQQALRKEAQREATRKAPRQNVQSIIDNIEQNLVTRDGDAVSINEEGLTNLLAQTENIEGWSQKDKTRLNQYVKSLRREQALEPKTKKAPVAGRTITTPQSAGPLESLNASFKRTGKSKFIERVRKALSSAKGNDVILEAIAKAYRKSNPGKVDGDLASILTLTGKADSDAIAKVYALAQMLVTLRPTVTTIRPDNSLAIEKGNLSAFMRFDKVLDGVKENQLIGQIRQVFGEDATYTRINDFEVVVTNPKLTPIQFARRFGRLRGKRNDIRKSELFTAQTETLTHNWTEDPTGESIRSEIRRLGFGDILKSLDARRADYLDIAEEFGATEVEQYRQAPRAPPEETATEETAEAAEEAAFSLEGEEDGPMFSLVGKIKGLVKPGVSGSGNVSRRPLLIRNLKSVPKDADIREGVARFVSTDRGATIEYRTWDGNSWVSFRPDRVSLELTEVEENFINGLGSVENREMQEVAPSLTVRYGEGADPTVLYVDRDEVVRLAQHLSTFTKEDGVPPRFANTSWLVKIKDADAEDQTDEGPLFSLGKPTAAQKMQSWIDSKVAPIVETLAEDSENIRFRLPKDLSNAQKEKYKTAVGKFFARGNVTLGKDSVIASFPLPVTDNLQKSRAKKLSTVRILTGREKPVIEGTGKNGKIRKFDLGVFLQERTRAQGRIAIGDYSDAAKAQFVASMLEEVRYQLSQSDNAIGWYEEKVSNMMEVLGVIYPELNTDKNNEMVMKAFLAITSQGTEVDENIRNAVKQYEHYRNTGEIRIWGTGKSIKAMKLNHQALAKMIASTGLDQTTEFLEAPFTVKQLQERGFEVSGELMSYEGRGALIFGPKIGSFFGNLYGHYESLTADLWFSRTWNRISGNLLTSANVSKLNSTKQELLTLLKNARLVKPHLNGYKRQDLLKDEALRLEWAASVHGAWARGGYKNKSDELRTIKRYDEINNQLEDAPRNGEERGFMRSVIQGVKDALKKDGIDITTADIQAVLWYHEKDLYAKLGVADSRSEATDYEQAARRLLAEKRPDLGFDYVLRGSRKTDRAGRTTQRQGDSGRKPGRTKRDDEDVEAASLLPIDKPASGGLSASRLRQSLVRRYGERGIARLEEDGILKIVDSAVDLPEGLIKDADAAQRARGLFDPKTQTAYLIANRLNEIAAPKVLLHEVGTHFGLKRMMGADAYAQLIVELNAGKDTTFKPWFDRIRANYEGRVREGSDKFAEEVLAAIAEDTSDITLTLRQRIVRAVKAFLSEFFGVQFANTVDAKEVGYLVQGSLRSLMNANQLASVKLPRYMMMEGGDVQFGRAAIVFPEYTQPTRKLTEDHKRYQIVSAVGNLTRSEEMRLRRNMDGMMKVAERAYKKGYKNIDIHLPVVSAGNGITSRYAMFKNTQTGTELVIRMSDHPKDPFVAAGSFPFISYNNGHKTDIVDLSEIDRAVKLLSLGKLDGMNGLQFQFEYSLGDGVSAINKRQTQKLSYEDFLRAVQKRSPSMFRRIQENAQSELRSGAVIGEDGPLFSIADEGGLDQSAQEFINKTRGSNVKRSPMEFFNDTRARWAEKATQYWVDAYRPIKNLMGDDANRAWQMMQLSENTHGMLHALMHFGTPKPVYRNGEFDWYQTDFSNEGLMDILSGLDGEADRFMAWLVATRANRLAKEDREKNFTQEEIKAGLKLNQGTTQSGKSRVATYQRAMSKMSKLQASVLDMAVDAGVIDPEVRADLETDFYVPFYREFTEDGRKKVKSPTPAHDFVNIRSVIKRLRGSELNINDALHNMTMNWTSLIAASMKNKAGVEAMKVAESNGVARKLTDGKEIAQLQFSKGKSRNERFDNFVFVLENGKKVWYEVGDPLVLNAMSTLAWGGVDGKALRVMSAFKRWLTIGVTASPAFKIRNMIRDSMQAIGVGKLSYNAFGNAAKGYQALKDDYLVTADMMMGGGIFQFGYYNDDPGAIRRMVDAVGDDSILDTPAKAKRALGKLFNWYQDIGNRMENANRVSLYMQRKEEVGHLQASFEARDLLNFSSHGRGVAAQWLIGMMPFLNARIQGLDKLVRAGRSAERGGERARLLAVVGTITLASILLRLSYEGDEDYDELEEWQKETYWPIKIPGTSDFLFLPKPFEIGAIASLGDRITENFLRRVGTEIPGAETINKSINKYTSNRLTEILINQLAFDLRPQIARPVIELWRNKNAFTDRQIENLSWQISNLPNALRVRPYTSEVAKTASFALGKVIESFGGNELELNLSPVQIDHLIKGYFGWLGATTVGTFDIMMSDQIDPLTRIDEMSGLVPVGSFYSAAPRKNNKYMTLFYEQMKEVNTVKQAYNGYKRSFEYEQARQFAMDNKDTMAWVKTYQDANNAIQKINKRIGFIYKSDMTPAEKREELDRLSKLKTTYAKRVVLFRAKRDEEMGKESENPLRSIRAPE